MKRKVRWSKFVKIFSAVFLPVLIAISLWAFISLFDNNYGIAEVITFAFIFFVVFATLILVYVLTPISVELTDSCLLLHRGIGVVRIKYSDITELDIYKIDGSCDVRVCGIGGVCGFVGRFYNKKIGYYTSYVGDYSQAFLVKKCNGRKYVFSCEDRDNFLSVLKNKLMNEKH